MKYNDLNSMKQRNLLLWLLVLCGSIGSIYAEDWTRVTDVSVLAAGDRIVMACPSKGMAAGEVDASKKILTSVAATFSEDESVMTSEGKAQVFVLGGKSGAWTLANASGQLLSASATKKVGYGLTTHTWAISVGDNGLATIQCTNTGYGRFLYNVNSPRFTTYTSKTTKVMLLPTLYRKSYKEYHFEYQGYTEKTTRCQEYAYAEGTQITLSKGKPTKEGYTFAGWLFGDKTYQPGEVFTMPAEDVSLVARWKSCETGLHEAETAAKAKKVLRDNTLYIEKDGNLYDVLGNKH